MKSFLVSGQMKDVYLKTDLDEVRKLGALWYPELESSRLAVRQEAARTWRPLQMSWMAPNQGDETEFSDAIGYGLVRGIGTFVSERACQMLEPIVGHECEFLPVNVRDAPSQYFVLYVTRLLDCLDQDSSRFGRSATNLPTPISVPRIMKDRVDGYLFRLAGGRGYQFDYDFATERFFKLVQDLGLTGFRFREDLGSKWIAY